MGKRPRRPAHHTLVRIGEAFPHRYRKAAQSRLRKGLAQAGESISAAGEEEGRAAVHHGRHRVAVRTVGRAQIPILPGSAQAGCQQLHARDSGEHADILPPHLLQAAQQLAGAGVDPRVSAEEHTRPLCPLKVQQLQNLLRADRRPPAGGASLRQVLQQPGRADQKVRLQKSLPPLLRKRGCTAAAHAHQCQRHLIISSHSFTIDARSSP